MNLADPSVGDVLDRLSILSLKEDTAEVQKERSALMERISFDDTPIALTAVRLLALVRLAAVNGRLWEMHEHPEHYKLEDAVMLNKLRRELVARLG